MGNNSGWTFSVRNFRGCERADIVTAPIALIVGDGGASKSSVCQAVAAAVTGTTLPMPGITKAKAGMLLRSGTDKGLARVEGDDFTAEVSWPKAEYRTDGPAPVISAYAAGLASILDLEPKKRGAVLSEYLKTMPSREDLIDALADEGFPAPTGKRALTTMMKKVPTDAQTPTVIAKHLFDIGIAVAPSLSNMEEVLSECGFSVSGSEVLQELVKLGPSTAAVEAIWPKIEMDGWDQAWQHFRDRGIEHKGGWRAVTGEEYGSKKADTWHPAGWDDTLIGMSLQTLEREAADANDELEQAISEQAVSDDELIRLRALAADLPDLEAKITPARAEEDAAELALNAAVKARDALPLASQDEGVPCPHCEENVVVTKTGQAYALSKPVTISAAELKKRRTAVASADGTVANLRDALAVCRNKVSEIESQIKTAKTAAIALAEAEGKSGSEAQVDAAREKSRIAVERREAFTNKLKADRLHRAVASNQLVVNILAEAGLRKTKTIKVLDSFNSSIIGPICEVGGWEAVTINPDMEIEYNGRNLPLLCKSERARCRIAMQVAMAVIDSSALVIIDDADELPEEARGGLLQMLLHADLQAIVAMMVPRPDVVPDLGKMKLGTTYWIADGVSNPVTELEVA